MPEPVSEKGSVRRRSVLDLAPLELDCMNTLWPMGEGTVREIRDGLAARRPRAYTTIMTIMDRLARKGVVERRKSGRAYIYRPNLSAEEARSQALGQVVENFFGGSKEAMIAQLGGFASVPRALAVAAGAQKPASSPAQQATFGTAALPTAPPPGSGSAPSPNGISEIADEIDDTLL